jgi:hypothetical protein
LLAGHILVADPAAAITAVVTFWDMLLLKGFVTRR